MAFDLRGWSESRRTALDRFSAPLFRDAWPAPFAERLRYPYFGGGKRVRPLLCIAAYEAVAEDPSDLDPVLPAAVALELVHTYSLVHDDLPAMDDDDERRGLPTVHKKWDEASAILVGDGLLTEAFGVIARAPLLADSRVALIARLADSAGYRGMVGGQAADVGVGGPISDLDTLVRLHAGKTGALLQASAAFGGIVAEAAPADQDALETYGRAIGLAFQLADDVLDAEQDAGESGPPSYVKFLGVEATLQKAKALAQRAMAAADTLPEPAALLALARYMVERDV
jgi:geranylgeranyl pyrophosphate synthase